MATKKTPKKSKVKTTVYKKANRLVIKRTRGSRIVSFFVGVATVVLIGAGAYLFIRSNNYKQVLGTQTQEQMIKITPIDLK